MTSEIIDSVLTKISRKMANDKRNILLSMDNVPCHPENFVVSYSNMKVVFLPKNTTSFEIIQEVDILKAISEIKASWEEVSDQTVINYFCKCGFCNKTQDGDVQALDQGEDKKFANLVKELAGGYVDFGKDFASSMPAVDAGILASGNSKKNH